MDSTRVCAVEFDVRCDELPDYGHRFAPTSVGCTTGHLLVHSRSRLLETPGYFSAQFDHSPTRHNGFVSICIFLPHLNRTVVDGCAESDLFLHRCAHLPYSCR